MVNVTLLASSVSAPTGLWAIILNWIESGIVNYGWVIIVFTLLIKLCLSPLDFLIKFSTKKSTLVQQKLAPQIARINKKYQNDRNQAQLQTNALYKREGYNVFGSCIIMLLNLAITMTVFLTLFNSLRVMSAYKAINQYDAMQVAYTNAYNSKLEDVKNNFKTEFDKYNTITDADGVTTESSYDLYQVTFEGSGDAENLGIFDNFYVLGNSLTETQATFIESTLSDGTNEIKIIDLLTQSGKISSDAGDKAANKTWKEVKENWLWIDNIWIADNYKSPIPTYNDLLQLAKNSKNNEYKNYVNNINQDLYNTVTGSVQDKVERWNGYFILAILAGATSFLSQFISEKMSKSKNKRVNQMVEQSNPAGGTMKFMKILLPALMVIFVLTSSSAFGIYIVWSSIVSMGISALTSLIVNACYKKKEQEIIDQLEKEVIRSMKKLNKNKNK